MGIKTTHKGYGDGRGDDPHGVTNTYGITNVGPYDKNDPINIFRHNILNYSGELDKAVANHPSNRKK